MITMNKHQLALAGLIDMHETGPRFGSPFFYSHKAEMAKLLREFCDIRWVVTDFTPMEIAQLAELFEEYKPFSFGKMLLILSRGAEFNYRRS